MPKSIHPNTDQLLNAHNMHMVEHTTKAAATAALDEARLFQSVPAAALEDAPTREAREKDDLNKALTRLNLEEDKFSRIHTKAQKEQHLQFKYLQIEFYLTRLLHNYESNNDPDKKIDETHIDRARFDEQMALAQQARRLITEKLVNTHPGDIYSEHSYGISDFDTHSGRETLLKLPSLQAAEANQLLKLVEQNKLAEKEARDAVGQLTEEEQERLKALEEKTRIKKEKEETAIRELMSEFAIVEREDEFLMLDPNFDNTLEASLLVVGTKNSGVEPGFKAIRIADLLAYLDTRFSGNLAAKMQYIRNHNADITQVYRAIQTEPGNELATHIPTHLLKMDYDLTSEETAGPGYESLRNCGIFEKCNSVGLGRIFLTTYARYKTGDITAKNIEAVLEVLANNIAGASGLDVQRQILYLTAYHNGKLKLMPDGEWLTGSTTLATKETPKAGGPTNQLYRVKPALVRRGKVQFVSDRAIRGIAKHLPLFATQGDYDGVGSKLQNKLQIIDENGRITFYGIDFGHAYQYDIVDEKNLGPDFHILLQKFTNYSIYYDMPRSCFVSGLLTMAKINGDLIPPEITDTYGKNVTAELALIEPSIHERIFDDYIAKFTELSKRYPADSTDEADIYNRACCLTIVRLVTEKRKIAIEARKKLVEMFKPYIGVKKRDCRLSREYRKSNSGTKRDNLIIG